MLVLFKGERRGVASIPASMPLSQLYEIGVKQLEILISYKQQGKILEGGFMARGKGSCAIFDVDSIEELRKLISQLPMFPYMEVDLIPLVTFEHALGSVKERLASIQSSK